MPKCWICKAEIAESSARVLDEGTFRVTVHTACLGEFALVAREALGPGGQTLPTRGIERLTREVDGNIVLIHHRFPNEQLPILVYLAHFDRPVPVPEVYNWLRENELRIRNPSLALLKLSGKGLVATQKREDQRWAISTDDGRRTVDE